MKISLFYKAIALSIALTILSGCATILAPRYQKVNVKTPSKTKLLVDGEKPKRKKGLVVLDKYKGSTQLTITKEGFKDENKVIFKYKRSPLRFLSLAFMIYPFFLDFGPKSYKYDKEIDFDQDLIAFPKREEDQKEIQLNKVSMDIEKDSIKYRYFKSYKNYLRKEEKRESEVSEDEEKVELENTQFTDIFNDILKSSGFVDTSSKVLKNSYSNNLFLNATVESLEFHAIGYYSMTYMDIGIRWEVLDFYKEPIFEITTNSKSGEFTIVDGKSSEMLINVISDAMEIGLIDFLNHSEVQAALNDKSEVEEEKNLEALTIPKSSKYVSSVSQSVNAGVTIKNKDGHGSGFFISSEGHIITNYHVISNKEDLKVKTNAGEEYDVEVIRVSKMNDLALLKIDGTDFLPFKVSSSEEINIGNEVYALGTPSNANLSQSISKGIISGQRETEFGTKLIQTDVSINSGNSGGALLTKDGTVVGIVSSKLFGFGIEGVAFGIPAYELEQKLKLEF